MITGNLVWLLHYWKIDIILSHFCKHVNIKYLISHIDKCCEETETVVNCDITNIFLLIVIFILCVLFITTQVNT
jgi:hypothetical protein